MTTTYRARLWVSFVCSFRRRRRRAVRPERVVSPAARTPLRLDGQAYVAREGRRRAVANLPLLDGDRLRTEAGGSKSCWPTVRCCTSIGRRRSICSRRISSGCCRDASTSIVRGAATRSARSATRSTRRSRSVQTGGPGDSAYGRRERARPRGGTGGVQRAGDSRERRRGRGGAGRRTVDCPRRPRAERAAVLQLGALGRIRPLERGAARRSPRHRLGAVPAVGTRGVREHVRPVRHLALRPGQGAVWYPAVRTGWRPYSVGFWRTYPAWGSFWIGGDPWGWPTHHYGHWGFSFSFGWYWRPATVWGPAWVSWAVSPGYVSWCPLGRHGFPVFGHFGVRGRHAGGHVDPWRGWTVVPRNHFGRPTPVHRVAVDGNRLGPSERGSFAVGRPVAVTGPRGAARERRRAGGATPVLARRRRRVTRQLRRARFRGAPQPTPPRAVARRPFRAARGGAALPDGRARLSPDEAARILTGNGRAVGTAARRPLPRRRRGSAIRRTTAPEHRMCRIRQRRNQRLPLRGRHAPGRPAQFGNGAPAQFGNGRAGAVRGTRRARTAIVSARESIRASAVIVAGGVRRVPTSGAMALAAATARSERRAYPRGAESPAQSAPRDNPVQVRRRCRGLRAVGSSSRWWQRHSAAVRPSSLGRRHLRQDRLSSAAAQARPRLRRPLRATIQDQARHGRSGGGSSSPPPRRRGGAPD